MIGKFAMNTLWMLLMIVISGLIYIRMAPHNTAALHVPPPKGVMPDEPAIRAGSAVFVQLSKATPADILASLDATARATPRTRVLAGSIEEGMITYVTRSLIFGFPDYTTVQVIPDGQGSRVTLFARLRFGRSDSGVNRARIRNWLEALKSLDQAG